MWRHDPVEHYLSSVGDVEEESVGGYHGPEAPDPFNMLMMTSIEQYTTVQRGTARQLRCDCTEVLSLRAPEMASTSFLGPQEPFSHLMYFPPTPEGSPSSVIRRDGAGSIPQNEDDIDTHSDDDLVMEDYRVSHSVSCDVSLSLKRKNSASWGETPPGPPVIRRRLRTLQTMPTPSLVATQVANRLIRYARCTRNIHEKDMCCLNCGLFPLCPVTGTCGHTRCIKCIEKERKCPCGDYSPDKLHVNILIRNLIAKTTCEGPPSRVAPIPCSSRTPEEDDTESIESTSCTNNLVVGGQGSCSGSIRAKRKRAALSPFPGCFQHAPMSPWARFNHSVELLKTGQLREAAPHLAIVAASYQTELRPSRLLLAQVITILCKTGEPRSLTRELTRLVRQLCSTSWIKPADMECVLCCDTFTNPVTTPCGHMFCRTCIERTLDYKKRCPLCLRTLNDFKLNETRDTVFVQAALAAINVVKVTPPLEPDLIPIFVCTVAYPSVPCPLFIFDPRYWLMIRRVLESGSRKFGMVSCDRDRNYADYGTILEVRDCVHLEDGRSILSTIGLSRFKVIERDVRDGCEVARILPIRDAIPVNMYEVWELVMLANQVKCKAMAWLGRLDCKVRKDIEATFGCMEEDDIVEWWDSTDGPAWLWWLVAVLPLRSEIKVLILSTDCLLKRIMAVARTLEALEGVTLACESVPSDRLTQPS